MTTTTETARPRRRASLLTVAALGAVAGVALALGLLVIVVFSAPGYMWTAGNVLWALLLIAGVAALGALVSASGRLVLGRVR